MSRAGPTLAAGQRHFSSDVCGCRSKHSSSDELQADKQSKHSSSDEFQADEQSKHSSPDSSSSSPITPAQMILAAGPSSPAQMCAETQRQADCLGIGHDRLAGLSFPTQAQQTVEGVEITRDCVHFQIPCLRLEEGHKGMADHQPMFRPHICIEVMGFPAELPL